MAGKKGMKVSEEEQNRRKGIFSVTQADVLKAAIDAPTPEQIHKMLYTVGRPRCFENPEQMAKEIEGYFNSLVTTVYDEEGNVLEVKWKSKPTFGSMAVYLGVDRRTLFEYSKSDEFLPLIKRAKGIIHAFNEQMLADGRNPVGAINTLVNLRDGWVSDQKNITIEPVQPDNGAKTTGEIIDFLDDVSLPESQNLTESNTEA